MRSFIILSSFICFVISQSNLDLDASVTATLQWPQNDHTRAGAIIKMVYAQLGKGSCFVKLPTMVNLFHVLNAHVIIGEGSDPIEGRYKIAAPAPWEAAHGTINALIIFDRDFIFDITDIEMRCDPYDVADILVYSFPQNNLVKEASSSVYYRPGYHIGDYLIITLPKIVKRFTFTTMDADYRVQTSGLNVYILSGFKNPRGVGDMKEVHFTLEYENSRNNEANWFSAAQITVNIINVPDEVESSYTYY